MRYFTGISKHGMKEYLQTNKTSSVYSSELLEKIRNVRRYYAHTGIGNGKHWIKYLDDNYIPCREDAQLIGKGNTNKYR